VDKAPKSIKNLFDQLEYQMAENDENQDGAARKEAFERKMRVVAITEQEKKRYVPKQFSTDFHQQRAKIEQMMDNGFKVEFDDPQSRKEPVTELAKQDSAKAYALSKDEIYHNPPYKVRCPNPDKYREKWEVIDGVLIIGDKKASATNIHKEEKEDQPKKYNAKAAWQARLARMRKTKRDDDNQENKEDNDKPIYHDIFGDTHETRKLLEHPDIQFALGPSSMKRYVRADKPPPNYLSMNKKQIKTLESTVKLL